MSIKTLIRAGLCAAMLTPAAVSTANAQAESPYLGDIITVGFNYCPRGYHEANGALLAISSNTALFSLYGTIYGGDGVTNFALPDFRGRAIVHRGHGPGLSEMLIGRKAGSDSVTLNSANLPSHYHIAIGSTGANNAMSPQGASFADFSAAPLSGYNAPADTPMDADMVGHTGGNQSFSITNPSVALKFCVATVGVYPSRN